MNNFSYHEDDNSKNMHDIIDILLHGSIKFKKINNLPDSRFELIEKKEFNISQRRALLNQLKQNSDDIESFIQLYIAESFNNSPEDHVFSYEEIILTKNKITRMEEFKIITKENKNIIYRFQFLVLKSNEIYNKLVRDISDSLYEKRNSISGKILTENNLRNDISSKLLSNTKKYKSIINELKQNNVNEIIKFNDDIINNLKANQEEFAEITKDMKCDDLKQYMLDYKLILTNLDENNKNIKLIREQLKNIKENDKDLEKKLFLYEMWDYTKEIIQNVKPTILLLDIYRAKNYMDDKINKARFFIVMNILHSIFLDHRMFFISIDDNAGINMMLEECSYPLHAYFNQQKSSNDSLKSFSDNVNPEKKDVHTMIDEDYWVNSTEVQNIMNDYDQVSLLIKNISNTGNCGSGIPTKILGVLSYSQEELKDPAKRKELNDLDIDSILQNVEKLYYENHINMLINSLINKFFKDKEKHKISYEFLMNLFNKINLFYNNFDHIQSKCKEGNVDYNDKFHEFNKLLQSINVDNFNNRGEISNRNKIMFIIVNDYHDQINYYNCLFENLPNNPNLPQNILRDIMILEKYASSGVNPNMLGQKKCSEEFGVNPNMLGENSGVNPNISSHEKILGDVSSHEKILGDVGVLGYMKEFQNVAIFVFLSFSAIISIFIKCYNKKSTSNKNKNTMKR